MSKVVNILEKIASFDDTQNGYIKNIVQFQENENSQYSSQHFKNDAKNKTYEQGFNEGYAQAEIQAQEQALITNSLNLSFSKIRTEIETSHRRVVTALLQAALPTLIQNNKSLEITNFIMSLSSCALEGSVKLKVSHEFEQTLTQIVKSCNKNEVEPTVFTIEASKNITGTIVQAFWGGGFADIDIENVADELLARIEQN